MPTALAQAEASRQYPATHGGPSTTAVFPDVLSPDSARPHARVTRSPKPHRDRQSKVAGLEAVENAQTTHATARLQPGSDSLDHAWRRSRRLLLGHTTRARRSRLILTRARVRWPYLHHPRKAFRSLPAARICPLFCKSCPVAARLLI